MEVDAPRTVTATGGRFALVDNCETPDTLEVAYEYEKNGQNFLLVWSHTDANTHGLENKGLGIMFQGTEATLVANYATYRIVPEKGRTSRAAQSLAALGGPSPRVAECHQEPLPVLVQLRLRPPAQLRWPSGQHCSSTGEKLKWDAAAERITNHSEANTSPHQGIPQAVGIARGMMTAFIVGQDSNLISNVLIS